MHWRRLLGLSVVSTSIMLVGTVAPASAAEPPQSTCRDQIAREIDVPDSSETVTVNAVVCREIVGDKIRGYAYVSWENPGHDQFHDFTLIATVDKEADIQRPDHADTDEVQLTCEVDLTAQVNRKGMGGGSCSTDWFDFGGKSSFSGDGSVEYNLKQDGDQTQAWWFWGPDYT